MQQPDEGHMATAHGGVEPLWEDSWQPMRGPIPAHDGVFATELACDTGDEEACEVLGVATASVLEVACDAGDDEACDVLGVVPLFRPRGQHGVADGSPWKEQWGWQHMDEPTAAHGGRRGVGGSPWKEQWGWQHVNGPTAAHGGRRGVGGSPWDQRWGWQHMGPQDQNWYRYHP